MPRIGLVFALVLVAASRAAGAHTAQTTELHRVLAGYGRLPLAFERVIEATQHEMRFIARGAHYAVAVSAQGVRFALRASTRGAALADPVSVGFGFAEASASATITGADPLPARIHHLRGTGGRSDVDAPAYERVVVSDLYPGIDLVFHGSGGELEFDVVVSAEKGDPSRFAMRIDEGVDVSLTDAGELLLATSAGTVTFRRPLAYQDIDGERRTVGSRFALEGAREVRIATGPYDGAHPLIIDPVVSYATYLGGNSFEQGLSIAVDGAGNAYVAGYTASTDFPTVAALDRSLGKKGDVDAFVSKLNAAGTALVWSTYIGGSASVDRAIGIAVDGTGSAYITGSTSGSDFPTTGGAWQTALATGGAFVAKLAPAGNALVYSTYVAGASASGIAVDALGNAFVAGSAGPAFVTTSGALQTVARNSGTTAFILKLNAAGTAPLFATFLGGTGSEDARAIAVDARGFAYVGGWTTSLDFPTQDALQSTRAAGKDGFVAKLDPTGSRLVYSTLIGGALDDSVNAVAVDAAGSAYVAGETYSWDFPVKSGFQPRKAGTNLVNSSVGNAFVAKIAPSGGALAYSSFLGGEVCLTPCQLIFGPQPQFRADAAYGIAVDGFGHAYVGGIARSYTFPLIDSTAARKQEDNEDSAFVAKVSISGGALLWSTFLRTGFNEGDNGWTRFPPGAATGVAVDGMGALYVTGDADSASNFQPSPGAFQTSSTFGPAAIVAKFLPSQPMSLTTSSASADTQTPITLTASLTGPLVDGTVVFMDGAAALGNAPLVANAAKLTTTLPAGIHSLSALVRVPGSASDTPVAWQLVDVPLTCNAP